MHQTIEAKGLELFFTDNPTELQQPVSPESLPGSIHDYLSLTAPLGAEKLKEAWLAIDPGQTAEGESAGLKRECIFNAIFSDSPISPDTPRASRALELLLPYMTLPPISDTVFASGTDIARLTPNNTLTLGAVLAESLKLNDTSFGERMPYWALSRVLTLAAVEQKIYEQHPHTWTTVVAEIFKHLPEPKDDVHPILETMLTSRNPAIQALTRNTLRRMVTHYDFSSLRSVAIRRIGMLEPSEVSATTALYALQEVGGRLHRTSDESEANACYDDIALAAKTAILLCPERTQPVSDTHLLALGKIIGTLPQRLDGTDLKKRLHASLGELYAYASDVVLRDHIESLSSENPSYILRNLEHLIDHNPKALMIGNEESAPLWIPLVEVYIGRTTNFPKHVAQALSNACYENKGENYAYDLLRYATKPARDVLRPYVNQYDYSLAISKFTRESERVVSGFLKKVYQYSAKDFIISFFNNPMALRYLQDGIEDGLVDNRPAETFKNDRMNQISALWEKAGENVLLLDALDQHQIDASRMTTDQARTLLSNASTCRIDFPRKISASLPHVEARFVQLVLHDPTYTDPHQEILRLYSLEHRRILNAPSSLTLVLSDLATRYSAVLARRDDAFMNSLITSWMRYVRIRGPRNALKDIKQCAQSSSGDIPWHTMIVRILDTSSPIYEKLSTIKPYNFSPDSRETGDDAATYLKAVIDELRTSAMEAIEQEALVKRIGAT